ncbi:ABC transporter ATP-binding protein [Saliphagus sp. LR7]|uniref:ABC transporter ATP-binding protein n=1 Tax=Saliphagus sp. LR7 TaxID=2282654 RepID=UPI000DF7C14E|nr:ABC transporter ATP-binding protein [Saliphagus sp. LR7]
MSNDTADSITSTPEATGESTITFDGVDKIYGTDATEETVTALQGINLGIESGEFVSVVGPSGCGKTTLLHLAAGILEPTNGIVKIDGIDVQSSEHDRSNLGLVFQQPVALEWRTVRKNVLLPVQILSDNGALEESMDYYRERADELLSLVGLEGFEDAYPNELSGGMQQRVTITQALIYDPSVLLMDEPFGSLDAMTKAQLNLELLRIWEETKKTVLFITHDLNEAVFLSDRVVILSPRPGEIVDTIEIDLPRPRTEETRGSDRFVELSTKVHQHFKHQQ